MLSLNKTAFAPTPEFTAKYNNAVQVGLKQLAASLRFNRLTQRLAG